MNASWSDPTPTRRRVAGWRILAVASALAAAALAGAPLAAQEPGTITGEVRNEAGAPLPGIQVTLPGTQRGTLTNAGGAFVLANVPAGPQTVEASGIGYRAQSQSVNVAAGGSVSVNFTLAISALALDEIVVTGQATGASRREIGTSIASIDAEALAVAPISSMSQMLQARAPGVNVLPGGGKAGQGTRIVLRGAASATQSNEPLIYVDGVRIDNSSVGAITTTTAGATWSGLDDINPDDIERIEVVRGASAATLYGTEAAGGVIQIFTKRGSEGATVWTYSGEAGILNTPFDWWDVSEYSPWFYDNMVESGHTMSHQLSARGGTERMNYFVSGNMRDEVGVLKNDGQEAYSFRLNLGLAARDDLTLNLSTNFNTRTVQQVPDANNTRGYTINGLVGGPRGQFMETQSLWAIDAFQEGSRFLGGLTANHDPFDFFSHRVTLGLDVWHQNQHQLYPYGSIPDLPLGYRTDYRRESQNINLDYVATGRFQLTDAFRSTTALGFQYLSRDVGSVTATGDDFPFFGLETVSATLRTSAAESRFQEKSAGFFGEQQFGFQDYLFLTLGVRADGHSAFGADIDYQIYPKASLSYVLSDHLELPEFFNALRLRGAYGTAGQQPANFAAVRSWSPTSAVGGEPAVIPSNIGNPDLRPEVTHEAELGFELAVLDNRLNLDFTYYQQETRDALYSVREPPSMGILSTQLRNVGRIENQGIELAARATVLDVERFRWEAMVNYSTNNNEIVDLGDGTPIQVQWLQWMREGYPVGSFFGDRPIEVGGEVGMASQLLRDADGNLPEGWDYIGPPLPTRTVQLGSTFNVGDRTSINLLFDHRGGNYAQSSTLRWLMQPNMNITDTHLAAHEALGFTGVATTGPVARACRNPEGVNEIICGRNSTLTQGDFAVPIDFWKLREVTLSYRMPEAIPARLGLNSATISLAGRNLWRSTDYPGLEPEGMYIQNVGNAAIRSQIFFDTPIPRHFSIGVQAQF